MGYYKDGRWVLDSNDEASGYGTAGTSGSGDALPAKDAQIESLQRALATQRTINSGVILDAERRGAARVLAPIHVAYLAMRNEELRLFGAYVTMGGRGSAKRKALMEAIERALAVVTPEGER